MATKDEKISAAVAGKAERKAAAQKIALKKAAPKKVVDANNGPGKLETAKVFAEEAKAELKKVTWPTKTEVRVTTVAVLILVVVMSIFLGLLDLGLVKIVEAITSVGR